MNPNRQTGLRRTSRWALTALVLTVVGVAVAQTADPAPSDEEVQAAVDKATLNPLPEVGGPRAAGAAGEVSLGSLRPNYSYTDVTVQGAMGPVSFVRRYGMDTLSNMSGLNQRPYWTPFGSMKADELGPYRGAAMRPCGPSGDPETRNDCKGGLRWTHNFESWVTYDVDEIPCPIDNQGECEPIFKVTWHVRDVQGRDLVFDSCSLEDYPNPNLSYCFARNHADADVKLQFFGDAFILHTPEARYVYAEPWHRLYPDDESSPGWVRRRLSYILDVDRGVPGCSAFGPPSACQRRIATLNYDMVCLSDKAAVRNVGDMYVTSIDIAGGSKLWLKYGAVYLRDRKQLVNILADGGTDGKFIPDKECVLKDLYLSGPGESSPPSWSVASYSYTQGTFQGEGGTSTQPLGGLLGDVYLSAGGAEAGVQTRLHYDYTEADLYPEAGNPVQPLRTFRVQRNGIPERELVMDAADGAYIKQAKVGDVKVQLWADNNYNPSQVFDGGIPTCHPGEFGTPPNASKCLGRQTQHQQAEAVLVGDGTGTLVSGVQQDSRMVVQLRSPHGALLSSSETQCTGATCNALAPLQNNHDWLLTSIDPCAGRSCKIKEYDYWVHATGNERDTRGNYVVYDNQLASLDAGVPMRNELTDYPVSLPPMEVRSVRAGASQPDGSDALLTRNFNYTYGPAGRQRVKDEWGDSALVPSGEYQVRRHYNASTGSLTGVVQSGYTLQFDAASNTWTPVLRHVGTFYRKAYSCTVQAGSAVIGQGDVKGRVVEVAGPCPVDGPDAQQCSYGAAPVPLTQYEYWPETTAPQLAGRLAVRRVFSETYADGTCNYPGVFPSPSTYLETRFEDYDARGHVTQVRDANDVVTRYVYSGDYLVETRAAEGTSLVSVTKYGYDTGDGTGNWVLYPEGRYEVQCFRTGTTAGAGCRGGQLTDKLQWKASSRLPDGSVYSERMDYTYAANGKLVGETVRDATGAVRRQRYFEGDPLGRTTYEATGSAAPGASSDSRFHQVSLFDMEGNRVGMGTAYQPTTSPLEPLCGGFSPQSTQAHALPASPLCKAFEYDRLNRLSRLMEPVDTQNGPSAVTCLTYDTRGNLASVDRAGAGGTCAPASERSVRYTHDDFGNLVSVRAPWAQGSNGLAGEYRYAYDTAGNLIVKQTPAMAQTSPSSRVQYTYDAMGRLLDAQAAEGTSPVQTLYAYRYDGKVPSPNFCPGGAGNSDGSPRVRGRVQVLSDSFGDTWFAYDVHGRALAHWRVRVRSGPARVSSCGRANNPNYPNRWFYYDQAGRLINEVLPGGRGLTFIHHGNGTSMPHRVAEVRATLWDGARWGTSVMTLLKDIQWEPYGGIKSYAVQTHLSTGTGTTPWRYVDYLRTAPATVPLSLCNATGLAAGNDYTGRLKALTVSTEAERTAGRYGDIYKRVYTWKADQLVREDTCLLETGAVAPETLQYAGVEGEPGYDMRGRLSHVTGRPHDGRDYLYDDLGNRLSERRGSTVFQLGYAPEPDGLRGDQLRTRSAYACGTSRGNPDCSTLTPVQGAVESYVYDADGRLSQKVWDASAVGFGLEQVAERTFGTALDGSHAALGAVYRSVSDSAGRTWEYFYDAAGRRRLKQHPSGVAEEYFYDKTLLLEDWGVTSLVSTDADSVRDEYIWLDGRPVVMFKARVNKTGERLADFTGTCERYSDDLKPACGVYFPVTDQLGKPVVMLDGAGRVTGVADYDAFGHINRVSAPGESPHPSVFAGLYLLTESTSALPATRTGISVHVRGRFSLLQGPSSGSEAFLTNGSNVLLTPVVSGGATSIAGTAGNFAVTPWGDASGVTKVRAYYSQSGTGTTWGAGLEDLEYRRFQTGATPVWTALRLPGQYHDSETDLFENWNRYYDPSVGRYLAPDPYLQDASYPVTQAMQGQSINPYSYASNNPIGHTDPTGNMTGVDDVTIGVAAAATFAVYAAICTAVDNCPWKGTGTALSYAKDKISALFNENKSGDANAGQQAGATQAAPGTPAAPATPEEAKAQADRETQAAIRDVVNSATNGGRKPLPADSAETILDWAAESSYPGARAGPTDVVGDHPGTQWDGKPHIHIPGAGRGGHVLVEPGVQPRDPKVFGGTK